LEVGRIVGVLNDDVVVGCKQMQKDIDIIAIAVDVADVQLRRARLSRVVVENVARAWVARRG
jgi:hypothetical protein